MGTLKTIQTIAPQPPRSRGGLKLVINGAASHLKGRLVSVRELPSEASAAEIQAAADGGTGVAPRAAYEGAYYDTDLGIGLTETADDITIKSAVCKVTRKKTIVETAITGRDGTVKEMISAQDYVIEVTCSLINGDDEYPEQAMRQLATLADENSAVYVDSAFLRLFNIDRAVITDLEVNQATYGNTQDVVLTMASDDDYEVEVTQST